LTATTISFPAKNAVDQFDHIMAIQWMDMISNCTGIDQYEN
jgi:hypothetical protein